jgi:hypothetical protein
MSYWVYPVTLTVDLDTDDWPALCSLINCLFRPDLLGMVLHGRGGGFLIGGTQTAGTGPIGRPNILRSRGAGVRMWRDEIDRFSE